MKGVGPGDLGSNDRFRRILLVGASSATGHHVFSELERRGHAGRVQRAHRVPTEDAPLVADLCDARATREMVAAARPTLVIHLAAARGDPDRCRRVNVDGTRHLLEAVAALSESPTVLFVSSSAVYGAGGSSPLAETAPLRPVDAYGATKAEAEALVREFAHREGFGAIIARPFNLVGPGLRARTAPADFARRLKALREEGEAARIQVGDLDAVRDFVDVRDAARAYVALAASDHAVGSTFNVATGVGVSVGSLLDRMIDLAGVSGEIQPGAMSDVASGVAVQVGDATAIRKATGWVPAFTLEQSLSAMLS